MDPFYRFSFIYLEPVTICDNYSLVGLVKIQSKGQEGWLKLSVKGSKKLGNSVGWLLYHQGGARASIRLGPLEQVGSDTGLVWEFNPLDVEGTGLPIDEFSEFAVTESEGSMRINQTKVLLKGRIGARWQAWQASEG